VAVVSQQSAVVKAGAMAYKFEKLEVWQLSMDYSDMMYAIIAKLPHSEDDNLKNQLRRAATSITLNIAEGSTTASDADQARFVGMAIRSLIETVACQHHINRRKYLPAPTPLREAYQFSEKLFAKLQSLRASLKPRHTAHEEQEEYHIDSDTPF
jgi:four helix bundle protein